jgi:4-hydroxy-3-methylbut-2-enyl diphosphate reductase
MISSNANELQKIGNQYLPTYLVNSVEEIKKEWFEGVKVVTLTSAASTPDELTDSIYEYLIKL